MINKQTKWLMLVSWLLLAACSTSTPATPTVLLDTLPALSEVAGTPSPVPEARPTLSPSLIALGADIYAMHCAECHGADLEGEADWQTPGADGSFRAPPHDQTGHTWHHSDSVLREAILLGGPRLEALGNSEMPAFAGTLSDEEIEAVLVYIKSSWPEEMQDMQWEQSVRDPG